MNTIQIRMMNIPKAMAMTNTALRVPTRGTSIMAVMGFSHMAWRISSKTEETAVHESEKDGEDTGAADDAGKIHMFFLIQDQSAQEQDQSLSHVSEHGAEDQGVGDGHEPGGIHLIVGRQACTSLHTFQKV